ncbi:hypothetical protein ACIA58_10965 [Kribbella sp. NPDC051586]|uniref:hypothetical protein n=1 Tax=Kribbella sp. NPDC051586 TaxID=3364118 RepID=UPI0037904EA8
MTLTEAARWRRVMVRPVLESFARADGVDAVMMSGSSARGDADQWSDVEVGVFWQRPPSERERLAAAELAGAVDVRLVSDVEAPPPWYDHLYLREARPNGLMIEVAHMLTTDVESALDGVLVSGRPDDAGMVLIKGILDGRDPIGPRAELVAEWKERAAAYPRDLAIAVVQHNGNIEKFWRLRMLVDRDNPFLLAREFVRIAGQLLIVLHALNGQYCGAHPLSFKRLDTIERDLSLAPPSLASRLRAVFTEPATEGAQVLRDLVEETFDLVECHLPEVDVNLLRTTFRSSRKPLDSPD